MPMAQAAPIQIEGPPPVGSMKWISQRPLWQKLGAGGIIVVMIGAVLAVLLLGGGCDCPAAYKERVTGAQSGNGYDEDICHCSGDIFSCNWKCEYPVGAVPQCYSNGQQTPCSEQSAEESASEGAEGTPPSEGAEGAAPPAPTAAT